MKTLLALSILALTISFASNKPSRQVYICNNGKTTVYHLDKDCHALRDRCTHGVVPMGLGEAQEKGLKLCGVED